MRILLITSIFITTLTPIYSAGAQPTIEFLFKPDDSPGDGYLVNTVSVNPFPKFATDAVKICVYGMWTLYSTDNFGIGNSTATSFTVKGSGPGDCSTSPTLGTLMKTVKSMKALSDNLIMDKCRYYPKKNFLCGGKTCSETMTMDIKTCDSMIADADLEKVGSFWITAMTPTKFYIICGKDTTNCVCLDPLTNGPFAVSDVYIFPKKNPLLGLSSFKVVNDVNMCNVLSRPIGRSLHVTIDY